MEKATEACLDVQSWRRASTTELCTFHDNVLAQTRKSPSVLAVRRSLSPVDIYCYLKARSGSL